MEATEAEKSNFQTVWGPVLNQHFFQIADSSTLDFKGSFLYPECLTLKLENLFLRGIFFP
jgi:hypothetical protein